MSETSQNPLNEFRSYSYYFMLMVCDSTRTANEVEDLIENDLSNKEFRHGYEKFSARVTTGGGRWALLVNGSTDTQLIIRTAKIQSILNPGGAYNGESFYHTMNLQGEIILQEPLGIRLHEIIGSISKSLCVESTSLIYLLKPVFVGYPDPSTGSGASVVIGRVKPYMFSLLQITSVIDEGGAVYNMQTFGIVNGVSKMQRYQNVAAGFNFVVEEKNVPLTKAFERLALELNGYFNRKLSTETYDVAEATSGRTGAGTQIDLFNLRPLKYEIHIDPEYQNSDWKVATVNDPAYTNKGDGKYYFTQGIKSGIEELIRKIMNSCDKVINDRGGAVDADGKITGDVSETTPAFIYKIHSALVSDPDKITIKYYVHRYSIEFVKIESKTYTQPKARLEYDYIYTGKNVDIKEFTMKINNGVFIHPITSSNTLHLGKTNYNSSGLTSGWSGTTEALAAGSCIKRDLGIGKRETDNDPRNTTTPVSSGTYFNILKRWSSLESLGVDLLIKGNPNLMDQTNFTADDIANFVSAPSTIVEGEDGSQKGAHRSPLYVKVNVKFPLDYSDPRKGFTTFWYDGPYSVYTIENIFEDGDFLQKLKLYAMKMDIYGDISASDKPENIAAATTPVTPPYQNPGTPNPINPSLPPIYGPNAVPESNRQTTQKEIEAIKKQMVVSLRTTEKLKKEAKRMRTRIDIPEIPDIPDIPLDELRTIIDTVRDGIDGLRSEVKKYEDFITNITDEVKKINAIKEKAEAIISETSTVGLVTAIESEFNILEKLKVDPNSILNVINKKAPFLKETWMTFKEAYKTVKDQYDKLQESYAELKSIYGELLSFKEQLENLIPK